MDKNICSCGHHRLLHGIYDSITKPCNIPNCPCKKFKSQSQEKKDNNLVRGKLSGNTKQVGGSKLHEDMPVFVDNHPDTQTLSDKIFYDIEWKHNSRAIYIEDVREFIKKLKDKLNEDGEFCKKGGIIPSIHPRRVKEWIDTLAGEDLI
jgi:hypothetical protein